MKLMNSCLIFLSLFLVMQSAHSQVVTLRTTDYGFMTSFPALQSIFDDFVKSEQDKINNDQPIKDPQRLVKGIADSVSVSSRGIGTDYVTQMKEYVVGVSIGAAADFDRGAAIENVESGLGGAAGLVVGKKLNDRLNIYVNVGGLSHSETFQGIAGSDLEANISSFNTGIHLRYDLVPGSGDRWFGWGGVKTHFGYEYNYNELTLVNDLNEDVNVDLGGQATLQGRLKGHPRYVITSKTHSVPLEFSTDVKFLKYFSLFGGLGGDLNFGKATGEGDVKAKITSPLQCVSGVCTNLNLPEIEAQGNLDEEENVELLTTRGFGGLQLNFGQFSAYGMLNKTFGTKILGVTLGSKIVF